MTMLVLFSALGLVSGLSLSLGGLWWTRRRQRKMLERQGEEFILKAQEKASLLEEEAQERVKEFEEEAWGQVEESLRKGEERLETLQHELNEKEEVLNEKIAVKEDQFKKRMSLCQSQESRTQKIEKHFEQLKTTQKDLRQKWVEKLLPIAQAQPAELKESIKQKYLDLVQREVELEKQSMDQELQLNLEREAKRILTMALNRFERPYCPERGIGNVEFSNPELMKRVLGPNRENLALVEKACGVDITVNEEYLSATVLGFDPVRRELGRASLEKLIHEREISEARVNSIVEKTKKDLFKKIKQDGDRIAKELNLRNLHPEIRNMMGSLRYRYSFAQNQYFHCGEVGWLCGLLSSELGLSTEQGRRAGMLHDIGKAMDHSREGGHAVIGADFIEKHAEETPIVHAVRAHHFDETPSTDLAYLVIAADAISGARPGARRSTMDSYTQKMADLEKIGNSFEGVNSTYILSAGREVRVYVDSQRVDDYQALDLSKKIAHKIEEECNYPGLIKVTVVRETHAVDMAR